MNGYAGKILRINLTDGKITAIPTSRYEQWVGGHGMGSAIFFDLVKDKTIDGFHPDNVVTIMTSPLGHTRAGGGRQNGSPGHRRSVLSHRLVHPQQLRRPIFRHA